MVGTIRSNATACRLVAVRANDTSWRRVMRACLRVATRSGGRVVDGLVVVQLRSLDLQLLHLVENEDG
mgnify:CR=1 FL=1